MCILYIYVYIYIHYIYIYVLYVYIYIQYIYIQYIYIYSIYIYIWLVVYLPLWKIWKSLGMMTFSIYGKIKHVPTNQICIYNHPEVDRIWNILKYSPLSQISWHDHIILSTSTNFYQLLSTSINFYQLDHHISIVYLLIFFRMTIYICKIPFKSWRIARSWFLFGGWPFNLCWEMVREMHYDSTLE